MCSWVGQCPQDLLRRFYSCPVRPMGGGKVMARTSLASEEEPIINRRGESGTRIGLTDFRVGI